MKRQYPHGKPDLRADLAHLAARSLPARRWAGSTAAARASCPRGSSLRALSLPYCPQHPGTGYRGRRGRGRPGSGIRDGPIGSLRRCLWGRVSLPPRRRLPSSAGSSARRRGRRPTCRTSNTTSSAATSRRRRRSRNTSPNIRRRRSTRRAADRRRALCGSPQNTIRSEPVPPPPGVPDQRAAGAAGRGAALAQRVAARGHPRGPVPTRLANGQLANPPGLVDTTLQPGDEIVTEPPAIKIINPTAVFSGLDKINGRITSFDVAINETVAFGALQVTPRVCYTRPADRDAADRCVRRGRGGDAAGRDQAHLHGLDARGEPGPASSSTRSTTSGSPTAKGGASPAPVAGWRSSRRPRRRRRRRVRRSRHRRPPPRAQAPR